MQIQIVHMLHLPTSITDLLFVKENKHYSSVPENFWEAFQMLRNKYQASIESITLKFVYCNTSRYLNNFIEGNNITDVYLLENYTYQQPLPDSINIKVVTGKCKVPLHTVPLQDGAFSEYQILSSLLVHDQYKAKSSNLVAKTAGSYS